MRLGGAHSYLVAVIVCGNLCSVPVYTLEVIIGRLRES